MTKATYTEDNFEEYYRELVENHCRENGMLFRLDEWDGARENMREDAVGMDDGSDDPNENTYSDQDLIDEYLYFCLEADLDDYLETSDFADNHLSPVHDDQDMTWEMWVYREGDKPYSHYDTGRMDLYRGSYTFDKTNCMYHFTEPKKVEFDI